MEKPFNWDLHGHTENDIVPRFKKKSEIFLSVLKEEEVKILGDNIPMEERPSTLMSQCATEGKGWFNNLILEGSMRGYSCNWKELQAAVPSYWKELSTATAVWQKEANAFAKTKMKEFGYYKEFLAGTNEWYAL